MIIRIKGMGSNDPDPDRATIFAEAASYVPRWVISVPVNTRNMQGPRKWGVAASTAYFRRQADKWVRALHMKYLSVRRRSLSMQADNQSGMPAQMDDTIRNLSSLL